MLPDFAACRIAVVGDLVLDLYLEGTVDRLSPEAPVAVLARRGEREVLGGAANVAANIASLGARVALVGVVGRDEPGRRLADLVAELGGIDPSFIIANPGRPTTTKTRVMSGLHQLVRIDSEVTEVVDTGIEAMLVRAVQHVVEWADVVVLSDYAKGVCSDRVVRAVVESAARLGKSSVVDPKRDDFAIYAGATLIKPNKRELAKATGMACAGEADIAAAAAAMIALTGAEILLTRSEEGMTLFARGIEPLHVATSARAIFDVSGAGDTVVAVLALGIAVRMAMGETMRLANLAAGIVVGKLGTAVVTLDDLEMARGEDRRTSDRDGDPEQGTLLNLRQAVLQRRLWARQGLRVGVTNGCYDLLHPGHVALLQRAGAACDRLIVALNTDASVRRLKGAARPV